MDPKEASYQRYHLIVVGSIIVSQDPKAKHHLEIISHKIVYLVVGWVGEMYHSNSINMQARSNNSAPQ